jgi:hypothetical protein
MMRLDIYEDVNICFGRRGGCNRVALLIVYYRVRGIISASFMTALKDKRNIMRLLIVIFWFLIKF